MTAYIGKHERCQPTHHAYIVVYRRPLRRLFRKTFVLLCCRCNLLIEEP